ncbi:MAG: ABC transporter ATP-binding protein [Alphaproteobacteria bacterium]|jgi:ABC-2 type transport system ATP-binding protein|nr:ABC transporter ATP-binding protein [Alphaproteobacteria bacterium]
MSDAIYVKNLVKEYNAGRVSHEKRLALNGLDINIEAGSIFGLLGPNGAGKSTLINILAGTVIKTSGEVKVMGIDIDKQPKKARSLIGIVPQEIVTDTFFPLWQALEFTAGYFGIKPENRITDRLLKALSLYDKRNSLPQRLSGGMKRRFLIAKAMVHSPNILVLDEPTAGVDIELRNQLWDYVKKLNQEHGVTIIITTHYLAEAQELCDNIAFINDGKIIKQDSKKKLLAELGSRYLDVEFESAVDSVKVSSLQNIKLQLLNENKIRFDLHTENNDFTQILDVIHSMNLKIKNLSLNEPDLEDIFHKIVKK